MTRIGWACVFAAASVPDPAKASIGFDMVSCMDVYADTNILVVMFPALLTDGCLLPECLIATDSIARQSREENIYWQSPAHFGKLLATFPGRHEVFGYAKS